MKKYPKPVLCEELFEASYYKSEQKFEIEILEKKIKGDNVELFIKTTTTSQALKNLISAGKAKLTMRLKTNLVSKSVDFSDLDVGVSFEIQTKFFERIDKLEISARIVATHNLLLKANDEMQDFVNHDFEFAYETGEIMAISNTENLYYSLSGNPFISIVKSEEQEGKGLLFSAEGKNVIKIKVGPSFNDAYARLKQKPGIGNVLNSSLAFEAILFALERMIFGSEELSNYQEREWFKALEYSYESTGDHADTFVDYLFDMRREQQNPDLSKIFCTAQELLNNQIESKVIEAGRKQR